MKFFFKDRDKTKTELSEQVSKFMEHHKEQINKAYKLLQEEMQKNEALHKENDNLKAELAKVGGYPGEVANALLELRTQMDVHSVKTLVLFGMSVVRQ